MTRVCKGIKGHKRYTTLTLLLPATLLVCIQTSDEMDELLRDEFFGHDQLQLGEVGPLLLRQRRHCPQISTTVRVESQTAAQSD